MSIFDSIKNFFGSPAPQPAAPKAPVTLPASAAGKIVGLKNAPPPAPSQALGMISNAFKQTLSGSKTEPFDMTAYMKTIPAVAPGAKAAIAEQSKGVVDLTKEIARSIPRAPYTIGASLGEALAKALGKTPPPEAYKPPNDSIVAKALFGKNPEPVTSYQDTYKAQQESAKQSGISPKVSTPLAFLGALGSVAGDALPIWSPSTEIKALTAIRTTEDATKLLQTTTKLGINPKIAEELMPELRAAKTTEAAKIVLDKMRAMHNESVIVGGKGLLTKEAKVAESTVKPTVNTTLEEARSIANGELPKTPIKTKIKEIPGELKRRFITEFSPATKYETKIYKEAGQDLPKLDLTKKLEQVAGAPAKAQADLNEFARSVLKGIKGQEEDFNTYLFLQRTADRLATNAETRKVGTWTIEKANQALHELRDAIGNEKFVKLEGTAVKYQDQMDKALRLQVDSGRMTERAYKDIKESNDFYAPFKVMKYLEDTHVPGAAPLENMASLTKKITGITSDDFQLKNILASSQEQIYRSRLLAEKNIKLQQLGRLASVDKLGNYVKQVPATLQRATRPGYDLVHYFKNGKEVAMEVPHDLAKALTGKTITESGLIGNSLRAAATPFRYGATVANAGFQAVNLLFADLPRLAIISKYGFKSPKDFIKFPQDFTRALFSSFSGNFGKGDALYNEYLRSGAANATLQSVITPGLYERGILSKGKTALNSIAHFSNAIEETSKILGFKRGMEIEGLAKLPKEQAVRKLEEIVSEVRNYAGSPDFAKHGADVRQMNLIFMFLNARIQGIGADVARLASLKTPEGRAAWLKLTTAVGVPTATLAMLNNSSKYKDDYYKVPETERNNYFMIPRNSFFTDADGNKVRDYYRIPKRDIVQVFSGMIEGAIKFGIDRDGPAAQKFAQDLLQNISPINISGNTLRERGESVISSTNPLIKVPIEYATGRNTFYHQRVIPRSLENVSPAEQYKATTPEFFKKLGKMTNQSPLLLEQAARSFTGGGLNQFTPGTPAEGRSAISTMPIASRFFRSQYVDDTATIDKLNSALLKQNDAKLTLKREAQAKLAELKSMDPTEANTAAQALKTENPKLYAELKVVKEAEDLGITYTDSLINQLGVKNGARAMYIYSQLESLKTPEEKQAYYSDLRSKKVISDAVNAQLKQLLAQKQQ